MSDASIQLTEAYNLIESGDLEAARNLLDSLEDSQSQNPDYWWLVAHAAEDPQSGQTALEKVEQLDGQYPGLQPLMQNLGLRSPQPPSPMQSVNPASAPPPSTLPDMPSTPQSTEPAPTESSSDGNQFVYFALALIVVAIVIGLAFILPNLMGDSAEEETPVPTEIADNTDVPTVEIPTQPAIATEEMTEEATDEPTEIVTEEATDEPTEIVTEEATDEPTEIVTEEATDEPTEVATEEPTEVATEEATDEPVEATPEAEVTETVFDAQAADEFSPEALAVELFELDVPEGGVSFEDTLVGNTLVIQTCADIQTALTSFGDMATVIAEDADALEDDVQGIGISIVNCETDTVTRTLGITRDIFDSFVAGDIESTALQSQLRPIR